MVDCLADTCLGHFHEISGGCGLVEPTGVGLLGDHFGHTLRGRRNNGAGSDADFSAGHRGLEALTTHAEADGDLNLVHTRADGLLEEK